MAEDLQQRPPIEGLMKTAMETIKEMVNVNTVVGDPIETPDGMVIIPISRVCCGFAAGGGEFKQQKTQESNNRRYEEDTQDKPLFGGGSGAGVSVLPVGFLVVGQGNIRFIQVDGNAATLHRLIDLAPQVLQYIQNWLRKEPLPGANNPATGYGTMPTGSYGQTPSPAFRPPEAPEAMGTPRGMSVGSGEGSSP